MTPEEILERVVVPREPRLEFGRLLYDFVVGNKLARGLQLRRSPGISTVYLAGAIRAQGGGRLNSVWCAHSRRKGYNVVEALNAVGLGDLVWIHEEPRSYNWRLMTFLQEGRFEEFDFCVIERGTTWYEVGYAVCLVERLLKPKGWLILDNLLFSFRESTMRDSAWVKCKPESEQTTRQVESVFELLVEGNPYFSEFRRRRSIAFSQKNRAVWAPELRSQNQRAVIIGKAVERARRDPEFRCALSHSPHSALADMFDGRAFDYGPLRFVNTDHLSPRPGGTDPDGTQIIYLDRPKWERNIEELALMRMLKDRTNR